MSQKIFSGKSAGKFWIVSWKQIFKNTASVSAITFRSKPQFLRRPFVLCEMTPLENFWAVFRNHYTANEWKFDRKYDLQAAFDIFAIVSDVTASSVAQNFISFMTPQICCFIDPFKVSLIEVMLESKQNKQRLSSNLNVSRREERQKTRAM